ncbi:AaceriAGR349Wp [[Ashbya] aceris (nom. inval.)]|nr:AaceriAGR349Wp [[Ashbya] aceris (nom. inval.)]
MSELLELKQDVELLNTEISSIERQLQSITEQIQRSRAQGSSLQESNNHAEELENQEYEIFWADHPELRRHLLHYGAENQGQEPTDTVRTPHKSARAPAEHDISRNQSDAGHRMFDAALAPFLDTEILRSPSKRGKILSARPEQSKQNELRNFIEVENCYRMCGITFFPLVDPGRLGERDKASEAIANEMLGIRLEVFNENTRRFEYPYYVLLRRDAKVASRWQLFKHTLPKVLDAERIWSTTLNGAISSDNEVYLFAKKCYARLIDMHFRLQFIARLDPDLFENIRTDSCAAMLSFDISGGILPLAVTVQLEGREVRSCELNQQQHDEWAHVLVGALSDLPNKVRVLKGSVVPG